MNSPLSENFLDAVAAHYDQLIDESNDPVKDPEPLRAYMDKWDGKAFLDAMKLDKSKSVLEIGVGTGRLAIPVAPLCDWFYGIDISKKTIDRAKENLSYHSNVTLLCGDFLTLDFEQSFDVIYSSLTLMHIEKKQAAIHKAVLLLKIGGRVVLSIDKNQEEFIDTGTSKIQIFPDRPLNTEKYMIESGLTVIEHFETEFAHVFVAVK